MTKTDMHQRPVWLPKPTMFTILLKEEFAHPALHKQDLFLSLSVLETDFEIVENKCTFIFKHKCLLFFFTFN